MAMATSIDGSMPLEARRITRDDVRAQARLRLALMEEVGGALDAAAHTALLQSNEAFFHRNMDSPAWSHWCVEYAGDMVAAGTLLILERPPYPALLDKRGPT